MKGETCFVGSNGASSGAAARQSFCLGLPIRNFRRQSLADQLIDLVSSSEAISLSIARSMASSSSSNSSSGEQPVRIAAEVIRHVRICIRPSTSLPVSMIARRYWAKATWFVKTTTNSLSESTLLIFGFHPAAYLELIKEPDPEPTPTLEVAK